MTQTVGEAAKARYDGLTYDHALPQGWVDACCDKGCLLYTSDAADE